MIQYESVCLSYQGKSVFSNFNLDIRETDKILIQGKSGAGKTTLFRLILGFEIADSGRVLFNNQEVSKGTIQDIRRSIFYLSQDIDLRHDITETVVHEILQANAIQDNTDTKEAYLNLLELPAKVLRQNINRLSGGERQRVGLLIGFLLDRPVWLLDEPTSALDDIMKQKLVELICSQEKTVAVISHDEVWQQQTNITLRRLG